VPPKEKYGREVLIEAAFDLVRERGFEELSTRNLAARIGCSTQPIYSAFESAGEILDAVMERTKQYAQELILSREDAESNFLAIGLAYFEFSRKEPALFRGLFINGGWKWDFSSEDPFFSPILRKMRRDPFLVELDDAKLGDLFRDMFIYTHGLATQAYFNGDDASAEDIRDLLKKLGAC
jgi:AcrR family transcriptional regulator